MFRSVECQTDPIQYPSVSCQTDPIELGVSLSSLQNTDTSSNVDQSSGSLYEPTLSDIEDADEEEEEDETADEFDDDTVEDSGLSSKDK